MRMATWWSMLDIQVWAERGRRDDALKLLEEEISFSKQHLGNCHATTITSFTNYAGELYRQVPSRLSDAEDVLR